MNDDAKKAGTKKDPTAGMTKAQKAAYEQSRAAYQEQQARFQVNYGEKDDYVGEPFSIVHVEIRPGGNPQGEDDWAVTIRDDAAPEGDRERVLTFDKNRARDAMMVNFQDLVKRFGEIPAHTLQDLPARPGQSNPYTIIPIEAYRPLEEIEAERLQRTRARKRTRR